jgi:hypothetical protein
VLSGAAAMGGAGGSAAGAAVLAGFSRDVPRLRYPEVDVPMPLLAGR